MGEDLLTLSPFVRPSCPPNRDSYETYFRSQNFWTFIFASDVILTDSCFWPPNRHIRLCSYILCGCFVPMKNFSSTYKNYAGPGQLSRYSDSLLTGRSRHWIPLGATRFSAPVQYSPGAHPASYTMGIGSFPGVKRPGRGVDRPSLSCAEVEGRVELYICSSSGTSWPVLGWPLPLPLPL